MLWVTNDRRDAVEQYFAAVRAVDAQQQLHQRALARTIFTEQGEYLPRQNLQIHAIKSLDRAEALGDTAHINTHQSSTTKIASTSTAARRGRVATPTAVLAWTPASPKTTIIRRSEEHTSELQSLMRHWFP